MRIASLARARAGGPPHKLRHPSLAVATTKRIPRPGPPFTHVSCAPAPRWMAPAYARSCCGRCSSASAPRRAPAAPGVVGGRGVRPPVARAPLPPDRCKPRPQQRSPTLSAVGLISPSDATLAASKSHCDSQWLYCFMLIAAAGATSPLPTGVASWGLAFSAKERRGVVVSALVGAWLEVATVYPHSRLASVHSLTIAVLHPGDAQPRRRLGTTALQVPGRQHRRCVGELAPGQRSPAELFDARRPCSWPAAGRVYICV